MHKLKIDNNAPNSNRSPEALSVVLHDMRTPLNHILGYSEILAEQAQAEGREGGAKDLLTIHAAGSLLLTLINRHFLSLTTTAADKVVSATSAGSTLIGNGRHSYGSTATVGQLAARASQGRLLVVDDSEANRDVLSQRLRRQGHEVEAVAGGHEALTALREREFDLVLLDIMMPHIDGYEVLRQLKADTALRHIPVIMITALAETDSVVRCIEMGADDYLTKPFDPILLRARIGACLEKKRAHDRELQLFNRLQDSHIRLQQLEMQRDGLTRIVLNDLRMPLVNVIANLQAMDGLGELNVAQQEVIGRAAGAGRMLLDMVSDIVDIVKSEPA